MSLGITQKLKEYPKGSRMVSPEFSAYGIDNLGLVAASGRLRPSGAACAKKGASGRMQRLTELVPIPTDPYMVRESSVKAPMKVTAFWQNPDFFGKIAEVPGKALRLHYGNAHTEN